MRPKPENTEKWPQKIPDEGASYFRVLKVPGQDKYSQRLVPFQECRNALEIIDKVIESFASGIGRAIEALIYYKLLITALNNQGDLFV